MNRWLPLLFAFAPLGSADEMDPFRGLEDPALRAEAVERLLARGTGLLPQIDEEIRTTTDAGVRMLLADTAAEIRRREPHGLRFSRSLPQMALNAKSAQSGEFRYVLRVQNRSSETVVLWPYLSLRVLDAERNEVARSTNIGRWGRGRSARFLAEIGWITLEPGKSWSAEESLHRYMHDFEMIRGWKLTGPAEYTLEFTYRFDRDAIKKLCDPAWEALGDPDQPWNRALSFEHTFTAALRLS